MSEDFYKAPKADLDTRVDLQLTASERLAKSRKEMEHSNAVGKLSLVWGIRLAVDLVVLVFLVVFYISISENSSFTADLLLLLMGAALIITIAEIIAIIGFFRHRSWSIIPLHIFAAIALLNFPWGTILSVIHYIHANKINFER